MSKRLSPESDDDSSEGGYDKPIRKKRFVQFETVRLSSVSSTIEVDEKVLAAKYTKLCERFRLKERQRALLEKRVEQMESRQAQDDAMLCIINRSWNRFDENVHLLLHRFDHETALEGEFEKECEGTKNFLANLSHWESEELDKKFKQRVEFSHRAITKLVQVFDHITQRNEKIADMVNSSRLSPVSADGFRIKEEDSNHESDIALNGCVLKWNKELSGENCRLQKLVTKLQAENCSLSAKVSAVEDQLTLLETRLEEATNSLEDMKYKLEKSMRRESRLDYRLAEYVQKIKDVELSGLKTISNCTNTANSAVTTNINKEKVIQLQQDLELQSELASSRLQELQEMQEKNKNLIAENERLKFDANDISPQSIKNSVEYLDLQTHFAELMDESIHLREAFDDAKEHIHALKIGHANQIDVMESEEYQAREQIQESMDSHEDELNQVRNEYEMLRLEFEQSLSTNEQSGPLNKEVRLMLGSSKAQIQQLKQETNRFKRKWKEAVSSLAKCNKDLETERRYREKCLLIEIDRENESLASPDIADKKPSTSSDSASEKIDGIDFDGIENDESFSSSAIRIIQKLKKRVIELQMRLDAVNSLTADQRERVEVLSRENMLKYENEILQTHIRRLVRADRREKNKYYSDEAQRKIRILEELNERLRKEANSAKQEEEGLMNDVETTGQAFEEMHEQNLRLLQQLKEKDDANLKLMAERIRANQYQKKMKEERERVEENLINIQNQLEAQQLMIGKFEEKEKILSQKNAHLEHQLRLIEQATHVNKRKAVEFAQSSSDYKAQLQKCSDQLNDAQQALIAKNTQQEADSFKIRRLEEEKSIVRKKLERVKKIEEMGNMDEVMAEEIRELKDMLTCPSCKVRRKDAVLTKCFHVFCMECVKTRYETRRRKCPKCNAAFGANDYRRMFFI